LSGLLNTNENLSLMNRIDNDSEPVLDTSRTCGILELTILIHPYSFFSGQSNWHWWYIPHLRDIPMLLADKELILTIHFVNVNL